jgi:hypothetical protein
LVLPSFVRAVQRITCFIIFCVGTRGLGLWLVRPSPFLILPLCIPFYTNPLPVSSLARSSLLGC